MDAVLPKPVKCRAENPRTCRYHAKRYNQYMSAQAQIRLAKEREEKTAKARLHLLYDLENNLNPKTLPTGETIVSVFRSGVPNPPTERGVENTTYEACDAGRPEGRQGRMDAVFASPTINGVSRWVRGNDLPYIDDLKVRELRVDYDNTYVYSVRTWEEYSGAHDWAPERAEQKLKEYWNNGLTLRQWVEKAKEDPLTYDPKKWEILIPQDAIKAVKPVSAKRVAQFTDNKWDAEDVLRLLT